MQSQYFDRAQRGCTDCPAASTRLGIFSGVLVAAAGTSILFYLALTRIARCGRVGARATHRLARIESHVGLQPKLKIIVSFYQIGATLGPVYGVRLHEDLTRWTNFMDSASLDVLDLAYPDSCIGRMRTRLLIGALWPLALILLGAAALACHTFAVRLFLSRDFHANLGRLLYWAILVAYLVLPSISRSIFKAKQCVSYDINVFTGERRSYLVADLDVLCSADDDEYRGLDAYFWAFFVLWPILVPLAFLTLLLWIRSEVRAQRVTPLARACRFLWRDYDPHFLFWEVVDLSRKLFLASLVLFIDSEHGSGKMLRLVVATIVSALYLAALALARPFKRSDDLQLACIANLLLTCWFVLGVTIQLCESKAYEDMCSTLVGLESARRASDLVVALAAAMLALSLLLVLFKTASAVSVPTIRLSSTGRPPILELPRTCHFHGFISHAWGTGQDQTHAIVRQMQLLLPGVKVWLDVDNLDDVGKLEESVADAMTFIIFLSAGYFKSFNCRRELYAALASKRPFIAVHEADVAKGGASIEALKAECRESCVEVSPPAYPSYSGPDEVLARVFDEAKPIVWVRVHDFQVESLKEIALRMLRQVPYYALHTSELTPGVAVPGEIKPHGFIGVVTILVCHGNKGAHDVAKEVKAAAEEGRSSSAVAPDAPERVTIREAEEALEANAPPLHSNVVFLLYLTERTFSTRAVQSRASCKRRWTVASPSHQSPSRSLAVEDAHSGSFFNRRLRCCSSRRTSSSTRWQCRYTLRCSTAR